MVDGRIGLQGKGTSGNNGDRVTNGIFQGIFLQRGNVEGSEAILDTKPEPVCKMMTDQMGMINSYTAGNKLVEEKEMVDTSR